MVHPVDMHVGQRVRQRRWMVGMTQQQLAEMVGIRFQQIQKYETGENRLSASRLWDIAVALRVPIAFFYEGLNGQKSSGASSAEPGILADKEALALVRAYFAMPDGKRRRLFDLACALGEPAERTEERSSGPETGGRTPY